MKDWDSTVSIRWEVVSATSSVVATCVVVVAAWIALRQFRKIQDRNCELGVLVAASGVSGNADARKIAYWWPTGPGARTAARPG
jgi:hypothetical protein